MNEEGDGSTEFQLFRMLVERVGDIEDLQKLRALVEEMAGEAP